MTQAVAAPRRPALPPIPGRPPGRPTYPQELAATAWVICVSGLLTGLVIGVLLRLAMLALRLASAPSVAGRISDDGFEIGRVTLFGIFNLLMLGVGVGVIGAAAYVAVMPWLIGPAWVRTASVGVTAMLVGGSAMIHRDGVDFTVLDTRAAVALFLALPLVSGLVLVPITHAVARRYDTWPRWLPVLSVLFPVAMLPIAVVLGVVALLLPVRRALLETIWAHAAATWLTRAAFALIPLLALVALVADLRELQPLLAGS